MKMRFMASMSLLQAENESQDSIQYNNKLSYNIFKSKKMFLFHNDFELFGVRHFIRASKI